MNALPRRKTATAEGDKFSLQDSSGQEIAQIKTNHVWIDSWVFSPDGQQLITAGRDGSIGIWYFKANQFRVKEFPGEDQVWSFSFSPVSSLLATADKDGNTRLWNLNGTKVRTFPSPGQSNLVPRVIFSPDGQQLAIRESDGIVRLWNLNGQKLAESKPSQGQIVGVGFSQDSSFLLTTVKEDGTVHLWNQEGKSLKTFSAPQSHIQQVSLSPDGSLLATREEEGTAHLWDWSGKSLAELKGHTGPIDKVIFSPDGKLLATAARDGTARLWDLDGKKLAQFQGSANGAMEVSFSPDGKLLVTAGLDGIAKLWDVESKEQVAEFNSGVQGQVFDLNFSPDGKQLAMVANDKIVRLWTIESFDDLMVRSCAWARGYLENNPNVEESDRRLCDGVSEPKQVASLSKGEKILVPTLTNPDKQAGVNAIRNGNFETAKKHLESYRKNTPNDPEALIYLNNAKIGNQKSYTIAISAPISSDVNGALEMLRGVAQAQNEINQAGGINNVPLRVLIADDHNDPDTAKQIAQELVKKTDVLGVVGHYASDVTLATGEIYNQGKLVAISPVSTSVKLTDFGKYIFRTVPNDSVAAKELANYMRSHLNKKKAAVFYNSKSGYSQSLKSEFVEFVRKEGGEVSNQLIFDLSDPDFNADQSVEQSINSGAEVLVLLPNTGELDDTLQVVKANNQRLPLLGGDDVYTPKTLQVGAEDTDGMIVAVAWHILASQTDFPDTSRNLWHADVDWRTAMSYDATIALIEGLKHNPNPTREGLAEILGSPDFSANGATGKVKFKKGDRPHRIQLVEIKAKETTSRSGFGYDFEPIP